ncbi:GumC family protein [Viscerimonas tarda]
MSKKTTKESTEFIDIAGTALYYLKYWKWFVISVIVCAAVTFIYLKSQPSVYLTRSNILIKTEDSRTSALSSNAVKSLGFGGLSASESIDDEIEIISSHTLIKQMVYELGLYKMYELQKFPFDRPLYNNSPVVLNLPKSYIDTLSASLTFNLDVNKNKIEIKAKYGKEKLGNFESTGFPATIKTDAGTFTFKENAQTIRHKDSYEIEITVFGLDYATEVYMEKVSIGAVSKKANVIALSVGDYETQRGKDILNRLVKLYNEDALDDKNKMALNTANFIRDRVDTISVELGYIESNIENYKKQNNVIDIAGETSASLSKMVSLKERGLEFEIQLSLLKMIEEYINNPDNKYSLIPSSGMAGNMANVTLAYNNLIIERARLLKNAHETNPAIVSLDNQLDLLRGNVKTSINNVRKEISLAKQDWAVVEGALQSKLNEVPRQERQFLDIKRQQQIKSEIYLFLLQKLQEAELTLASNTPKAKVVDAAYTLTDPIAPRRLITLFLGILLGGIIPVVVIWLKDMFKSNLSDIGELEKYTSIPVLGEICSDKSGNKVVVNETSNTSTAELFRLIRTNLQFVLTGKNEKVILITSSISGEGKSFFSLNLAASLSLIKGKKVVIVGLDIRNPRLTEYLSVKATKGITSYLASDSYNPEDIIMSINNIQPDLYFVPSGPIPPNPSELLLNDRLNRFFEYLRNKFDYILVDTAPVGMVSDTFSLARISDATIYLFKADYTNKSYLKLANNIVSDSKLKKMYLVMNGTKTKTGYGYGYGGK